MLFSHSYNFSSLYTCLNTGTVNICLQQATLESVSLFKNQSSWTQTTQSAVFLSVLPGDYVLRDPAGGPRGTVRVMIKWKYPFQPSVDTVLGRQGRQDRAMESTEREERRREEAEASQRPIAKPRVKVISFILVCQEVCELPVML